MLERNTNYFSIFLKGIAMGAADVVPGVSGGTIAFVSGIYQELLSSIAQIHPRLFSTLRKKGFFAFWKKLNGNFLASLGLGIAISILSLAKIILYLLAQFPSLLWSFFFGLIIASSTVIVKKSKPGIPQLLYLWF